MRSVTSVIAVRYITHLTSLFDPIRDKRCLISHSNNDLRTRKNESLLLVVSGRAESKNVDYLYLVGIKTIENK